MGTLKKITSSSAKVGQEPTKRSGSLVRIDTGERIRYNPDPERSLPVVTAVQKQQARERYDSAVKRSRENRTAATNGGYTAEDEPGFLERLGSAAKSVFSGVASNAASAWGTLFQNSGGTAMTDVYEDQLRSIDLRIAAAEKQLREASADDPMRRYIQQDLDQLLNQKNTYEKSVQANRETGSAAVKAADEAAAYSQQQRDNAKQGLGKLGSAAVDLGTGIAQLGLEAAVTPFLPSVSVPASSAGSAATTYRTLAGEDYEGEKALGSAALGLGGYLAGAGLSRAVGTAGLNVMRNAGVQNKVLPNVITGGLSGVGFSAGMTGASELSKALADEHYQPDWGQISTDAVAAFAFGAISSAVRIARSSSQNKAFVEQLNQEVQQRYATVKEILKSGSAAQKAQGAASVMDGVDRLRSALNNLQFVGAQKQVDSIRSFLNSIDAEMAQYLPNGTASASGAVRGPATAMAPTTTPASAPSAVPSAPPFGFAQAASPVAPVAPVQVPVGTDAPPAEMPAQGIQKPQTAPASINTPPQEQPVEEVFPPVYYENIEREPAPEPETPGMTIPTGSAADLEPLAKTLGESGRKAITAFYDSDIPAADYAEDFIKAYNAGKNGTDRPASRYIGEPVAVAAYFAGQNDAKAASAVAQTPQAVQDTPAAQLQGADAVRNGLQAQNAVSENGFSFSVRYNPGSKSYFGTITREGSERLNGMVSDARSAVYTGSPMKTRGESIEDLIAVAERNRLFAGSISAPQKASASARKSDGKSAPMPEAETGKSFTATLYHGSGADPSQIYMDVQYPVAGKGRYYAMTQKQAKAYGDQVDVEDVTLQNPLVVRDDSEWRAVTQAAGWKYPNMFGSSEQDIMAAADAMRDYVLASGHDGLVIQYDDAHRGDINIKTGGIVKTLDNVFGHDQVVVYQADASGLESARADAGSPHYLSSDDVHPLEDFDVEKYDAQIKDAEKKYGISDEESSAAQLYVKGSAYEWTALQRTTPESEWSEYEKTWIGWMTDALRKLPVYQGTTYRNLTFKTVADYGAFVQEHSAGNIVTLKAFTSSSKDPNGYVVGGDYIVHMVIDGVSGHDMSGTYSTPKQQEVIFLPDVQMRITNVTTANDGNILIYAKEEPAHGTVVSGDSGKSESVQNTAGNDPSPEGDRTGDRHDPDTMGVQDGGRPGAPAEGGRVPVRQSGSLHAGGQSNAQGEVSPQQQIADKVRYYLDKGTQFSPARLFEIADKAYGGTMAQGAYTVKDAYDGMELAVNQYLMNGPAKSANGSAAQAVTFLSRMERLLSLLPTQTKRTAEMESFQQFSTPPNIAYLAAWAANVKPADVVLEPSAGIGGLALWPKAWGAAVYANELSPRRLEFLNQLGLDGTFNLNAEQIDNLLPDHIRPTVVIMNPPFSATAGRTSTNKTANAKRHIEQALERLQPGGRLVAILGRGMSEEAASFKSWWADLKKEYNVLANVQLDGSNYKKYGTNFDVQLVVIDKTGPTTEETLTGTYKDLSQIPGLMEDIRNERKDIVRNGDAVLGRTSGTGTVPAPGAAAGGPAGSSAGQLAAGKQRDAGSMRAPDGTGRGKRGGVPEEDRMAAPSGNGRSDQWSADRVGSRDKTPKSLSEIVEDIRHSFGLNITTGHIRGKGTLGTYNRRSQGIRSKIHNDLPTISHELGHHLDNTYGLTKDADRDALRELTDGLSDDMRNAYPQKKWGTEGLAEYVRKFLQNREVTAIDYPQFTAFFMGKLSGRDAAILDQLADEINAYYSLGADSAAGSIRLREERGPDARTLPEKIRDKGDGLYQAWVDINHGIKLFDEAVGADTYKLATNAAYSDAMAANIILHELRDADGTYVGPGLSTVLQGIDLRDKGEYKAFGEYLTVRHGPERLKEGMRVYADDLKNSTQWMQNRQAELEAQYPAFREVSDRLYTWQKQLLQTWGVNTGLVSAQSAKEWAKRWQFYVPFNRAMDDKQLHGARRGFANQNSTIRQARGSGRDIIHPVDNIISNMVAMVNAGVRNNVMRRITDAAERSEDYAVFLEKVPVPLKQKKFDAKDLKKGLAESVMNSGLSNADKDIMVEIVSNLDDILIQYGRGKAYGDVITVMKNGTQEFWKINDPLLLQSITNLSPGKGPAWLEAYGAVSRFMTGNITGKNLLWSIFSNAPRDLMTFFTYSKDKNPLHVFGSMGAAYANKIKGGNADPLFMEYLAMGGGQESVYSADRDLAKRARRKMAGSKLDWLNPMEWISFMSDTIEMGPRFATYKMMREKGMSPQDAFYEAMDITVNFRRGGRMAREVNKVVPFFNASVQGLDKFSRWIRAADAPPLQRAKVVRSRMISYLLASAALAAVFYGLNNSDQEKEADYQQLSNFTKNSYWLIPLGDGKYFAIPKPRELGVLSSFFETAAEFFAGENSHAFDEFYDYVTDNGLPPVLSELAKGDVAGAVGSLGIIGTTTYIIANRDFLGRPIESSGLSNLEPKDRYTSRTSQIAKAVGQAFNISPQKIDYFFNSVLGGFWKAQKALFPVGKENVDLTLGVQNTYIKDNQYSLDLVNWMYDQAERSAQASNSDPANMEKAIEKKMDANMTSFYSRYYALSKDQPDTVSHRSTRQTVLDMIREYQKAYDLGSTTKAQEAVYAICHELNSTDYLPGVMQATVKDGNDVRHTLSDVQYVEFQTEYLGLYWEIAEDVLSDGGSTAERASLLKEAKDTAKEQATNRALRRIGAPIVADYDYGNISLADVAEFNSIYSNATSDKDEDGNTIPGSKQEKVIAGIESIDGLTDEQRSLLFQSVYDSSKNNPWASESEKKYWWQ